MKDDVRFDHLDLKILAHFEQDGRRAISMIANDLKVSNTMVHQRVAAMKRNGILQKILPQVDERKLGYEWSAFTGIILKEDSDSGEIIEALKKIPEVLACYYITGQYTLFLRIVAKNSDQMRMLIYDEIDNIKGVLKTESFIDFGCAFSRNVPLE